MNWQDEQFVKVYTRDTGEWTLLSWDAQALLLQILRKVDRSGVLQLGKHGARVLPAALGHREQAERITAALAELTADGCIVLRPECLVVPNFIAAQTSRQSDKARQQSARDRRRAESMGASLPADKEKSHNVTDCHLESPDVTTGHPASPRVTLDKIRVDETRSDLSCAKPDPKQPELALVPQQAAESKQPKAQVVAQIAVTLFGELQAARKRCNPNVRCEVRKVLPMHTREIERCLREELTVDDLRHVIAVWEAQVKSGRQDMAHFDSVTPFRAANVAKYLQMSLDDAGKPRGQAIPAMRPPEPPKSPRAGESDFQRQIRESRERGEIT